MIASPERLSADEVATVFSALSHPIRVAIVEWLDGADEPAGPRMISTAIDTSLDLVSYHVRILRERDCIELVRTEKRRGAIAHFYALTNLGRRARTLAEVVR